MNAFAGLGFIGFFFVGFAIILLPTIFFLITLQSALSKCAPVNRTMTPGLVWLQIIPFFGFIWQFFVVTAVANSLDNEFRARRIPEEPKPGQNLGLAMCITRVCTLIPFVGILAGIASLILWILYWVKVAGLSHKLDYAPGGVYPTYGYGPGYPGAPAVGGPPYQGGIQQAPAYPAVPPAAAPQAAVLPAIAADQAPAAEAPVAALPEIADSSEVGSVVDVAGAAVSAAGLNCASCGSEIREGTAFCSQCGAKVG